jgi:hypothetical protein
MYIIVNDVQMNVYLHESKLAIAALILVSCALVLATLSVVTSSVQTSKSLSNTGSLKAVGVGIYWDAGLTNGVSSISWGVIDPGSNVSITVFIRNEGNTGATLSMTTSNWSPSNAYGCMTLGWNYGGETLNASQTIQVKLTLSVSSSAVGITGFAFDITIMISG